MAEDGTQPVIFYPRGGTVRQPWVKEELADLAGTPMGLVMFGRDESGSRYLYRAVDRAGRTVNFRLSPRRDVVGRPAYPDP